MYFAKLLQLVGTVLVLIGKGIAAWFAFRAATA